MIQYKNLNEFKDYSLLQDLWNQELKFMYPISNFIFNQNVVNCKYFAKEASVVALDGDVPVGFVISKVWDNDARIIKYQSVGFISLFFVARKFRRQGIGTRMFDIVEEQFKKLGKSQVWIGKDINNFFPGVPVDFDNLTPNFLAKIGYSIGSSTHDVVSKYFDKEMLHNIYNKETFLFKFVEKNDVRAVDDFFIRCFPGRWQYEFEEYCKLGAFNEDYLVVYDKEKVIGFVRISTTNALVYPYHIVWYQKFENLGGLGPIGIDVDYRGNQLAADLIKLGVTSLLKRGVKEILIDWTGLLDFYSKYGFEVWKSYTTASKNL
ncbi:MAG: GNAT family N-acetyltransferase [Bacilli bacterium]|jgi:predicted N-acetyltransferase YhbS|nr:GNAT family N-acetyltransferase [Bacilli bacterium]MDD3121075.1 GNAT family N-acetyltransferase [Bacilli bacterium]MDD4063750.1 GNAT family N-acetyltransferase [Bacilli bacterium]MDD4481889.1 GNAT family N-acetyltransferase [Bacilli bacterium]MDD5183082.1 GNAT family N-acetyltransferase [Bacilli bacterium]